MKNDQVGQEKNSSGETTECPLPALVHYLPARQAYRTYRLFGEAEYPQGKQGCGATGTQRITMNGEEVDCPKCKRWYWHVEGLQLSPQSAAYVASLNFPA